MLDAGEELLVQRLCELPLELLALAVHRLVLVLDMDVVAEQLAPGDEEAEALERALETSVVEEWEEFRLIARDPDVWDDVWGALLSLDRDHHDRLRAILEACCAMSTEYISGQGGLFQVLTAEEMLDSDVAAARDDRRVAEGFISPADARAFLELARRGGGGDARDPITRAYFRGLAPNEAPKRRNAAEDDSEDRRAPNRGAALATEADVRRSRRAPARGGGDCAGPDAAAGGPAGRVGRDSSAKQHLVAPLFEQAMTDLRHRDPALFSTRAREVGYLVNVWIAGGAHEGRRPRPVEALEPVLKTCEAGMRAQLAPRRADARTGARGAGANASRRPVSARLPSLGAAGRSGGRPDGSGRGSERALAVVTDRRPREWARTEERPGDSAGKVSFVLRLCLRVYDAPDATRALVLLAKVP